MHKTLDLATINSNPIRESGRSGQRARYSLLSRWSGCVSGIVLLAMSSCMAPPQPLYLASLPGMSL